MTEIKKIYLSDWFIGTIRYLQLKVTREMITAHHLLVVIDMGAVEVSEIDNLFDDDFKSNYDLHIPNLDLPCRFQIQFPESRMLVHRWCDRVEECKKMKKIGKLLRKIILLGDPIITPEGLRLYYRKIKGNTCLIL